MFLLAARLHGCYESLEGGNTGDAVVDFSGAVAEAIDLEAGAYYKEEAKLDQLFEDLLKVYNRGGIISCSIKVRLPADPPPPHTHTRRHNPLPDSPDPCCSTL